MSTALQTATLVGVVGFALLAAVFRDLLKAIVSLASASLSLAAYFYLLGAPYAAVFEALVAAGLVPVLFLFMISLTDESVARSLEGRKALVVGLFSLVLLATLAAVWSSLAPLVGLSGEGFLDPFGRSLWVRRSVDVLAVGVLLFVGVLAVVRLTTGADAESSVPATTRTDATPRRTVEADGGLPRIDDGANRHVKPDERGDAP